MTEELFFFTLGALFVYGHTMPIRAWHAVSVSVSYIFVYSLLSRKTSYIGPTNPHVFRANEAAAGTAFLFCEHLFVRRRISLLHFLVEKAFVVLMLAGYLLSLHTVFHRYRKARRGKLFVSTGIYQYVRHPFYLSTCALTLGIAGYLTSYVTAVFVLIYAFTKVRERVADEEKSIARQDLTYTEYQKRVPSGFFL